MAERISTRPGSVAPMNPVVATSPVAAPRPLNAAQLRAAYDRLAKQVTEAYKSGDQAGGDKLRSQKQAAFIAWRNAYNEDRHGQLDRLRKKSV